MEGPNKPDSAPDDWWWLAVGAPDGTVHLYELGYAAEQYVLDGDGLPTGEKVSVVLSDERHAEILAELGAPADLAGWWQTMAPGRPNRYLEPKEYAPDGTLLPIRARDGVTLHLLGA